ncbi:MAG: vanadium-dependent haloperoxidase [Pseudomonadota bacterium]
MEDQIPALIVDEETQLVTVADDTPSVSVLWDRAVQAAVIAEAPGPTIASRAYSIVHTAIYEAWAAYDPLAIGWAEDGPAQSPASENTDANKLIAMSYAAYVALLDLFPEQAAIFEAVMEELELPSDIDVIAAVEGSPTAIGIAAGNAVVATRADDGSNQANDYADTTGYEPVNPGPLAVSDLGRWTPENVPVDPEDDSPEQSFLTPQWGEVTPFGIVDGGALRPSPPEPVFVIDVDGTIDIEAGTVTVDGETIAITPDLVGTIINPGFIEQAEEVIDFSANLTDEQKLIAEFWEDGGGTSFPPGTWMTFGQFVSAREDHSLDEDARMFFALSNAVMDAGIATWEAKVFYDYVRPVRAIRDLGELGLIGTVGVDELTGEEGHVIEAWGGPGEGTRTILAENFITYQTPQADVSPPFAEYTSGHSSFSAAGAAVLRAFSETDDFGASVLFPAGTSRFEDGITPAEDVTLSWDTFQEAADEGGLSRLYGGIHFEDGDVNGRTLGAEVGEAAVAEAIRLIQGGELPAERETALEVARFYEAFLGRRAESGGLSFWTGERGIEAFDAVGLAEAFLGSSEFEALAGPSAALTPAGFVDLLFGNLEIDRESTTLDDDLEAEIEAGTGFAEAAAGFLSSAFVEDETSYLNALYEPSAGVFDFA